MELSLYVCDGGYEVDGASSDEESGLGGEGSCSSSSDICSSDFIDLLCILVEGEVSVGEEVLCDLLESVLLSLSVGEDLHSESGLAS